MENRPACRPLPERHFRTIHKLASYGFFRWRGVLIGTPAFVAIGNMLGVRWTSNAKEVGVDFADAGLQLSIALPTEVEIPMHDALSSLELGLLPIREFSSRTAAKRPQPEKLEMRIAFITPQGTSSDAAQTPNSNIELTPRPFAEFLLDDIAQGVVFARSGACVVNLPDPARFATHILLVHGERQLAEQTTPSAGLAQAAALIEWHIGQECIAPFREAWQDAVQRGPSWSRCAKRGRDALVSMYPALGEVFD